MSEGVKHEIGKQGDYSTGRVLVRYACITCSYFTSWEPIGGTAGAQMRAHVGVDQWYGRSGA